MADFEAAGKTVSDRMREAVGAVVAAMEGTLAGIRVRVREYDAAELGLGLRLCQAFLALVMMVWLAYAFTTQPASFAYDLSLVCALLQMATSGLSIWMIQRRARVARPFIVASTLVSYALWAVDLLFFGAFNLVSLRMGAPVATATITVQFAAALAMVAYVGATDRVRARLTRPIAVLQPARSGHSWDEPLRQRVRTWAFWRDLLVYFMVFSFMGHWAEMWFCYNIYLGVFMGDYDFSQTMLWKQWLFPYMAEGVAIVAIALILHPVKEALLKRSGGKVLPALIGSIAVTALVCTTIDFTCGMIANQDYTLWDYRALPFNFMGQICLQNSTVYTVAATLIVWVFYPLMDRGMRRLTSDGANALLIGLGAVYAFCAFLHFAYVAPVGIMVGV